MLAQRYPHLYDGIAAISPGLQWTEFFPTMQWPLQFMNMLGAYPHKCELDAIKNATIAACDGLDGVIDGIIGEPEQCLKRFDPFKQVGKTISCADENRSLQISQAAAAGVNATWQGLRSPDGKQLYPGLQPGTDISAGVTQTSCTGGTCVGVQFPVVGQWLQYFVAKDPNLSLNNLSFADFHWLVRQSSQLYSSIIGTDDPDLTEFQRAGGKMVTAIGSVSSQSFFALQ
jgi:hypothetical protein